MTSNRKQIENMIKQIKPFLTKSNLKNCLLIFLPYISVISVAFLIVFKQYRWGNFIIGSDTIFHYNRFYEAAMQIKHGNFSWFMHLYAFDHSGRVVNAFYGPLFAYLNGLLLLVCGTWLKFQLVSSFLVYCLAGLGMCLLFRKFKVHPAVSAFLSIIYIMIGWIPRWQVAANFTGVGAAMMPFCLLVAADLLQKDRLPWLKMALLMAIAVQTHLLTTLAFMAVLAPVWLYRLWKNPKNKVFYLDTVKAILLAALLSASTLLPLFWLSKTNHLNSVEPMRMMGSALSLRHVHILTNPFRLVGYSQRASLTYGLAYCFIAVVIWAVWKRKDQPLACAVALYGAFWLCLSSSLLPWGRIGLRIVSLAKYIQFPARMVVIAYPLILLAAGLLSKTLTCKFNAKPVFIVFIFCISLFTVVSSLRYLDVNAADGYLDNVATDSDSRFAGELDPFNPHKRKKITEHTLKVTKLRRKDLIMATFAARSNDLSLFMKSAKKSVADYLPIYKTDEWPVVDSWAGGYKTFYYLRDQAEKATKAYSKSVVSPKARRGVSFKVVGNSIHLTWTGKNRRLPIVIYAQSRLTVNGKSIHPVDLNRIGAPRIKTDKAKNSAVLTFAVPFWINSIVILSLLSWPALFLLFALKWILNKKLIMRKDINHEQNYLNYRTLL